MANVKFIRRNGRIIPISQKLAVGPWKTGKLAAGSVIAGAGAHVLHAAAKANLAKALSFASASTFPHFQGAQHIQNNWKISQKAMQFAQRGKNLRNGALALGAVSLALGASAGVRVYNRLNKRASNG